LYASRTRAGAPATAAAAPVAAATAPFASVRDGGRAREYFPVEPAASGDVAARAAALVTALYPPGALDLACIAVRTSASGVHVRLQQMAGGFAVHAAEAVVSFDRAAQPTLVAADLAPGVPATVLDPALDAAGAIAAALTAVGTHARALVEPPQVETLHRRRDGAWALEQRVRFVSTHPSGDWEVWLDARDARVREIADRTLFATGQARVFRPDPATALGDAALADGGGADAAVPIAAYQDVVLADLAPAVNAFHRLRGPWVEVRDWEAPWIAPDSALQADFRRTRAQPGFEDAMAYYHLDTLQRWYQELGFDDANHRTQVIDTHGLNGQDNSKFVPSLHRIACGDGGVDDAEDAAVLVHEYAHATQYDIVPTWGTGGHTGAMGEGFGDYLANSYAWSLHPERVQEWNGIFQWDGHNEYWPGRRAVDTTMRYPDHAGGAVHRAGTLWCSALTDALYRLGDRRVMDTLVLDHHYALTGSATMADAANAILAADVAIYSGAHVAVLVETFARWGLVDAGAWQPITFVHTPLDIMTRTDPVARLQARVASQVGTVVAVTAFVRGAIGAPAMAVPMALQPDGTWATHWPLAPGAYIEGEYWLEATDSAGGTASCPAAGAAAPYPVRIGLWADPCESDAGWRLGVTGDDAVTGRWVRAAPVGTAAQPASDHTAAGTMCFVTQNGVPGAPASDADVDGGRTTLVSPIWDLRGAHRAVLSYWRWYSNDLTTQAADDTFVVAVSNDAGAHWIAVERAATTAAEWRRVDADLVALFGSPDRVCVRFVVRDGGVGSVVEAGVDDVLVQADFATATGTGAEPQSTAGVALVVPTPGRGATALRVRLARSGPAQLDVFDARGRSVRRIWHGVLPAGAHDFAWDGRDARGRRTPGGVYFVRLETDAGPVTRKLTRLAD